MNWDESIWFFDVDDTLIETASASGPAADGVAAALAPGLGDAGARRVRERYHEIFRTLMAHHSGEVRPEEKEARAKMVRDYETLMERIAGRQPEVARAWGRARKWSREVFVALAAEDCGVPLTPAQILAAADGYWSALARLSKPVPGATDVIGALRRRGRPVFLVTSSDSRLGFNPRGEFVYDPKASEAFKRRRLSALKDLGLEHDGLAIGDPEDKPGEDFFRKGLYMAEKALDRPVDTANCVIVGDSFAHDLMTPLEKLGFGFGVLYARGKAEAVKSGERLLIVGEMKSLLNLPALKAP